jgi:hypothetical protein
MNRINQLLFKEVSIAPLVMFRIIFGALLVFGSLRFMAKGWVYDMYIQPKMYFGYLGFEWVKPLPGNWMYLPFILFLIGAIGLLLGAFYRFSTIILFLSFTYIELLDKSNYLNHYYFISLMTFLFIFVPANRSFSLDVKWGRVEALNKTSLWTIGVFKFQLAIVYVFAGIAKLEYDWLILAQPLKIWLQAHRDMPVFGTLLSKEWVAYFFSWFGCIYDMFIVVFLLLPITRKVAYFFVVVFHFVTWYLLPIGIFPWVMICSTTIFFSEEIHEKWLYFLKKLTKYSEEVNESIIVSKKSTVLMVGISLYVLIQVLVPFRYVLYPGNLFWNEEGFRFSWRVMLMHKEGMATFYVKDRNSGKEIEIRNRDFLSPTQHDQMATQPDMILQYAKFLKQKFMDTTLVFGNQKIRLNNPSVHADVYVSLNGRITQPFVTKKHDLTRISYNLAHRNWLEPFHP